MGVPEEQLAQTRDSLLARAQAATIEIWPENWHAVAVFLALSTQWRIQFRPDGMPVMLGLDYGALPVVEARCRAVAHRQARDTLFGQLRVLEQAALEQINNS